MVWLLLCQTSLSQLPAELIYKTVIFCLEYLQIKKQARNLGKALNENTDTELLFA